MKATADIGKPENKVSNHTGSRFQAFNPAKGEAIQTWYESTSSETLDGIVTNAYTAFRIFRKTRAMDRAHLLEEIGEEIMNLGDTLIHKCVEETGLAPSRIIAERSRTVNQLRLFADLLREGSWVNARIDASMPDRTPNPRPDIRQMQRPIGPVAVFEASNFPLAFGTAGGDTASALAAGCTVIVKGHSSHPGTSQLVASAIQSAVSKTGMPANVFSLVQGPGKEVGVALANHTLIKAIAFTGSYSGGKALYDLAARRDEPIPVYAEMGSINPVFILPGVLKEKAAEVAASLAESIVLGTGQFCTNPGLIILQDSVDALAFRNTLAKKIAAASGSTMLSRQIQKSYVERVNEFASMGGVSKIAEGADAGLPCQGTPCLLMTSFDHFMRSTKLSEEVFGPASLIVTADHRDQVIRIANKLSGHLTATIHGTPVDLERYVDLIEILEDKVGRIILNGVPTGVEVCHAMVHGGPSPATTDSKFTSVGTMSIYRFTRPVCYQDFTENLLPDELKNRNPLSISRLVNGSLHKHVLL